MSARKDQGALRSPSRPPAICLRRIGYAKWWTQLDEASTQPPRDLLELLAATGFRGTGPIPHATVEAAMLRATRHTVALTERVLGLAAAIDGLTV